MLSGRALLFRGLAAGEVAQGFFLRLPQTQLGLKRRHRTAHIRDDTPPSLQLQVHHVQMACDVAQKRHFTHKCFISKLCCVFPFAFHEQTDLLTKLETSLQHLSLA